MQNCTRENALWLAAAVQLTMDTEENQAHQSQPCSSNEQIVWRQLWWCCRVQDRILSIELRRKPLIPSNSFILSEYGFANAESHDEISRSSVCSSGLPSNMASDCLSLVQLSFGEICEGPYSDQDTHLRRSYLDVPEGPEARFSSQRQAESKAQKLAELESRSNPLEYMTNVHNISDCVDPADIYLTNGVI